MIYCLGMADFSDETMRSSSTGDIVGERPIAVSLDESSHSKKTCADCGTSTTPLWRGGPAGPKSLCNACGIKSRKKRGPPVGIKKGNTEEKKTKRSKNRGGRSRFMGLGREGLVKILMVDRQRRKMGEEEEAAVLLMALSHGFAVYA